jgi:Tat protein translocase TatC
VALFLGAPVLLWQLWRFVSAGLYMKEKRWVARFYPAGLLLFYSGVAFGYFLMIPYGLYFLDATANLPFIESNMKLESYFGFVMSLCLGLGAVFQLPLLQVILTKIGVISPATMGKYRGHFIIGAFVIAAILTPPDPYTQTMMALPMCLLYELGILCSKLVARGKRVQAAA